MEKKTMSRTSTRWTLMSIAILLLLAAATAYLRSEATIPPIPNP
jgi:hypothetical protein